MKNPNSMREEFVEAKSVKRKSIIAFCIFFLLLLVGFATWKWINNQPTDQGALRPLRKVLDVNENVFSGLFDSTKLIKEYPLSAAAKKVRANGTEGIRDNVDEKTWRLNVIKDNGDTLKITLDEIKLLPKKDIIFDFKCIEGWSQITHWAGVPLNEFIKHYHLENESMKKYIGLSTPDNGYYVGIDMPSALHPQTILCYEMNGKALPKIQGYPLRLIIPVKYGVKHLKRIGTMYFSNKKPADYWAERGYDYYTGH